VKTPKFAFKKPNFDLEKLKRTSLKVVTVLARTSLPEILFIATFVINHFLTNDDFSYPHELVVPILLLGILASIFFYLYRLVFRRVLTAHIAAIPLTYYLYHYGSLSRYGHNIFGHIFPGSTQTGFTMALAYMLGGAIFFGLLAYGIVRLLRLIPDLALEQQLTKLVLFIIVFNFVIQAGVVGDYWWNARHQLSYTYSAKAPTRKPGAAVTKPNIYYFVFDRYASDNTLKNVYHYDNSNFLNFLSSQQFVTRDNAYSNYPFTMSSISSTMAMDYLPELAQFDHGTKQTGFPYRAILNDPPVAEVLKQNGYQYNLLASWWDFDRIDVKAPDTEPTKAFNLRLAGHNFYLSDFSRDVINSSILSPILLKGVGVGNSRLIQYTLDMNPAGNFDWQLSTVEKMAGEKHSQPQFTYTHFLSPHDPYVFNADGTPTTYSQDRNDDGVDENVKYTNQLTYVNTQYEKMLTKIRTSDPNAVIIIQADEGPYPKEFRGNLTKKNYFDPINLPTAHMQQKFGVMASYYLPGVDPATVSENMNSNVNSFRFVLSHYLGYDLPNLPDCHISMGDKFQVFNYALVNQQLTGQPAPAACEKYLGPK
jgi:hypothetical protein